MRKKVKIGISVIVLTVCVIWAARVIALNQSIEIPKTETYQIGDLVDYDDNIFIRTGENRDGYQIQVKSARIVPYEQFAREQGLELPELMEGEHRAQYVYDVEASFFNTGAKEGTGIDLFNTWMTTSCTNLVIDDTLWTLMNPEIGGSRRFAVYENGHSDFHLPYVAESEIREHLITKEYLETETFYLTISLYPVRKRIAIGPAIENHTI